MGHEFLYLWIVDGIRQSRHLVEFSRHNRTRWNTIRLVGFGTAEQGTISWNFVLEWGPVVLLMDFCIYREESHPAMTCTTSHGVVTI